MVAVYLARCPRCGSRAVDVLTSSPDIPIYACGSWGRAIRCTPIMAADIQNVGALARMDMRDLLELVDAAELAIVRASSKV